MKSQLTIQAPLFCTYLACKEHGRLSADYNWRHSACKAHRGSSHISDCYSLAVHSKLIARPRVYASLRTAIVYILVETPLSVAQITRDFYAARFFLQTEPFTPKKKPKKEVDYFWKHQTSNSMLLTVTRLSLSHAGLPSQSWSGGLGGTEALDFEANVKDNGFPWPPPGLLGILRKTQFLHYYSVHEPN